MWSSQNSGAQRKNAPRRRLRRAARLGLADAAHAPRTVLGAVTDRLAHLDLAVRAADDAAPAAELVEARGVHRPPSPAPQDLPRLLDRRRARREDQVARDATLVVLEHHARPLHRFDDLDAERSDLHLGAFGRRAPRAVETVLACVRPNHAEGAVEDAAVRIDRHADAEVVGAVVRVAVEPSAVVDVAVAGRRVGDRLRRLVDRIVVELVQHGRGLGGMRSDRDVVRVGCDVRIKEAPDLRIQTLGPVSAAGLGVLDRRLHIDQELEQNVRASVQVAHP